MLNKMLFMGLMAVNLLSGVKTQESDIDLCIVTNIDIQKSEIWLTNGNNETYVYNSDGDLDFNMYEYYVIETIDNEVIRLRYENMDCLNDVID